MGHYASEDWWLIWRLRPEVRIKILKLDLLATKVLGKSTEIRACVFLAFFGVEGMLRDAFMRRLGVLLQPGTHHGPTKSSDHRFGHWVGELLCFCSYSTAHVR
jgi:hypothetical protein